MRVLLLANRPPLASKPDAAGRPRLAIGGLVSALAPIMARGDAVWLAARTESTGGDGETPVATEGAPSRVRFVGVPDREYNGYYHGFANRALWPLCHSLIPHARFDAGEWADYVRVNQRFADAALAEAEDGDVVWVHDYHFMLVPRMIRQGNPAVRVGFFLHIPFPAYDVFRILPWRRELLAGLLGADLVGFHTSDYTEAFQTSVARLLGATVGDCGGLHLGGAERCIGVGTFPISIDTPAWERQAESPATAAEARRLRTALRASRAERVVALGVDRLDYTKGILERLLAVERFLERHRTWRQRFVFVQIAVPSRTRVAAYQRMKAEIDQAVGRLNGAFGEAGWTPIRYLYRSLDRDTLAAYYRAADIAVVTPLRDGMNLVAKEYVACRVDDSGILVLSELAGAASELQGAFRVNPYDLDGVADTIAEALGTATEERTRRMRQMRTVVREYDVHRWWRRFIAALERPVHPESTGEPVSV